MIVKEKKKGILFIGDLNSFLKLNDHLGEEYLLSWGYSTSEQGTGHLKKMDLTEYALVLLGTGEEKIASLLAEKDYKGKIIALVLEEQKKIKGTDLTLVFDGVRESYLQKSLEGLAKG